MLIMQLSRRDFLRWSAGIGLASAVLPGEFSSDVFAANDGKKLKLVPIEIQVGATKPFKAVHASDTHFCFADGRENTRKLKLAENRRRYFSNGERFFDEALAWAKQNDEMFLHTGDLIDFVSESNLEAVQAKFKNVNCFVSAGNHEFSQYVGEAKEDDAYKAQSFDRVQKAFSNNLTFCSRIVNNVNFVAFDDVYYNVTAAQHERFKAEVAKGYPIVAMCHCPLYTPELFDFMMNRPGAKCAYLIGVPAEERMKSYEPNRREQQKPDAPTIDFLKWLKEQSLLKAILCGHLHLQWSGPFSKTATQHVVAGNYTGSANEITFV